MKPVKFLPSARQDLRAEKRRYQTISPELSVRFQSAVEQKVKAIAAHPEAIQTLKYKVRRWPLGLGFPHGILYRENSEEIIILAVFHPKRDPIVWQNKARI